MKRNIFTCAAFVLALVAGAYAASDEGVKQVQQALRNQGYYYGQSDGVFGDETEHAIRRYQIRNGLKVTGQLDGTTRTAILGGKEVEPSMPGEDTNDLRAPGDPMQQAKEADKKYLQSPPPSVSPDSGSSKATAKKSDSSSTKSKSTTSAKETRSSRGGSYSYLFSNSPYERASSSEQKRILVLVQNYLRRYGYYRGAADGIPGPATAQAIARYQDAARLRTSGRLDGETLELMGMQPVRGKRSERYYARETADPYYGGRAYRRSYYNDYQVQPYGGVYIGRGYYGGGYILPPPPIGFGFGFY